MPTTIEVTALMLAQVGDDGTPYLNISQRMGGIAAILFIVILILYGAQRLKKTKSK